jgi:hypothetical protein
VVDEFIFSTLFYVPNVGQQMPTATIVLCDQNNNNNNNIQTSIIEKSQKSPKSRSKSEKITNMHDPHSSTNNHKMYFANELALHPELINHSYAYDTQLRQANYESDLQTFTKIGRDLLKGNRSTFTHLSRYYTHPSKYKEFTREYLIQQWTKLHQSHIAARDLKFAHPNCPTFNHTNDSSNSMNRYTIYFTHNCCKVYGPAHHRTALEIGQWPNVLHYQLSNTAVRNSPKPILKMNPSKLFFGISS